MFYSKAILINYVEFFFFHFKADNWVSTLKNALTKHTSLKLLWKLGLFLDFSSALVKNVQIKSESLILIQSST